MFLSDREMLYAIQCGRLIVDPPTEIGPTSIDLHLDKVEQAKVWDIDKLARRNREHGLPERELRIGQCDYGRMSQEYHVSPPEDQQAPVFRRNHQIIVKPLGFVVWQTKEVVGTPDEDADLICFINGKSTRARTGLVVHLAAPTIHTSWSGNVTLEMVNLGPLHIVLQEGDVVAQLTVASVTSIPRRSMVESGSVTFGQSNVGGAPNPSGL
jgi:dCTP deaminase